MTADNTDTDQIYAYPDVVQILDRLSEMITQGKVMPMTAKVLVNKVEALELLEQARGVLPDDVIAAAGIVQRGTEVLEQADQEAADIHEQAQAYADQVRGEAEQFADDTHARAQEEAQKVIDDAHAQAEEIINDAHRRAHDALADAEAEAERLISENNVMREAHARAEQLRADTEDEAAALTRDANIYADDRMADLEELLNKTLREVEYTRDQLSQRIGD